MAAEQVAKAVSITIWGMTEGLQRAFCGCISTPRAATTVQSSLLFLILAYTEDSKHTAC